MGKVEFNFNDSTTRNIPGAESYEAYKHQPGSSLNKITNLIHIPSSPQTISGVYSYILSNNL